MQLQTHINIPSSPTSRITHSDPCFLIGSCFSKHFYQKLNYFKFEVSHNPFGVVYNPTAIANQLEIILNNKKITPPEKVNENWVSIDFQNTFNASSKEIFYSHSNDIIATNKDALKKAKYIFITLGTAWVYEYLPLNNKIAANCHKIPGKYFKKRLLDIEECTEALHNIIAILRNHTNARLIFTVSPVRHLKDGFFENQLSKSTLLLAVEKIQSKSHYFPSYELMLDELRDYRFYASDLVHPNQLAVDYIWERFSDVYFDTNTFELNKLIDQIQKNIAHKPFNKSSEAYQVFTEKTKRLISTLPKHLQNRFSI